MDRGWEGQGRKEERGEEGKKGGHTMTVPPCIYSSLVKTHTMMFDGVQ